MPASRAMAAATSAGGTSVPARRARSGRTRGRASAGTAASSRTPPIARGTESPGVSPSRQSSALRRARRNTLRRIVRTVGSWSLRPRIASLSFTSYERVTRTR
ncbi:hypothetical protein [Nonomuraea rubra]|uniref:hypothetical protein n=1 Tax=Nonomuraea rubra TaxID=46180 RepID=UPI0031EB6255